MTEDEKEAVAEKISAIFQGLELSDVADILKIQLAMLVTQGVDDLDGAMEFLDEIHDDVEEIVQSYPFGEDVDEDDDEEEDKPAEKPKS